MDIIKATLSLVPVPWGQDFICISLDLTSALQGDITGEAGKFMQFVQGPTAPKWQSQDSKPDIAVLKAHCPVLPPKYGTTCLSWSLESMTMSGGLKNHLVCLSHFTEKPAGVQRNDMACIEWAFRNRGI